VLQISFRVRSYFYRAQWKELASPEDREAYEKITHETQSTNGWLYAADLLVILWNSRASVLLKR